MIWRLASVFVASAVLLTGCGGPSITVLKVRDACGFGPLPPVALSERTRLTLRRYGLTDPPPSELPNCIAEVVTAANREPELGRDELFALAELHHHIARDLEARNSLVALRHYFYSAGLAYHYLMRDSQPVVSEQIIPAGGRDSEIQLVANRDTPPLASLDALGPDFRLAGELYNFALTKLLRGAGPWSPSGPVGLPLGPVPVVPAGFGDEYSRFEKLLCNGQFEAVGLPAEYRSRGLGVPLIAVRSAEQARGADFVANVASFPATAFLRFLGTSSDLHKPGIARLEVHNPLTVRALAVRGRAVPLESDLTTPIAYTLSRLPLEKLAYDGFLKPESLRCKSGLYLLDPYQPGKIPVVFVHGLLSSPMTWAAMFNDLRADPEIRERCQFWAYFYPTGNPFCISAADLRDELNRVRAALRPAEGDPALNDVVLVGHSMGGLLSRLQTVSGGDDFWTASSPVPFEQIKVRPETREQLRRVFYFEPTPGVTRCVFLGTPHRGSRLSPSRPAQWVASFIQLPQMVVEVAKDLASENPEFAMRRIPTSVDLLAPNSPALNWLAQRPKPPGVRYHSILGAAPRSSLLLERTLAGGPVEQTDGVVPHASSHLDDADSELIVPATHYTVHQHPRAVREVRRILLEHAQSSR